MVTRFPPPTQTFALNALCLRYFPGMGRPRKHSGSREVALRRVAAGESAAEVARSMGISPTTLVSWRTRGEGPPSAASAGTATFTRKEVKETPKLDLSDTVKAAVRASIRHLRAVAKEIAALSSVPDNAVQAAALRLRLAEAWGGLAKTAISAGLPKITVTSEASARGTAADIELLRMVQELGGQGGQTSATYLPTVPGEASETVLPPGGTPADGTPDPGAGGSEA